MNVVTLSRPSPRSKVSALVRIVRALPLDDWPLAIQLVGWLRVTGERGVGDTVARLAKNVGAAAVAERFESLTSKSCKCSNRQAYLNAKYAYVDADSSGSPAR